MRLRKPSRRAALLALLLPALLVAGYAGWWWWAAGMVRQGVLAWAEQRRAEGMLVEYAALAVEGFPFALRATVDKPHLAARGLEWQGTRLVAEAPPWAVTRVALTLPGEQRAIVAQPGQPPLEILSRGGGAGHALWTIGGETGGTLEQIRLSFTDLLAQPSAERLPVATLEVAATQPPQSPAGHTATGMALTLTAIGVTLPETAPPTLGRHIQKAELSARVLGRPPRIEPASLSAWSRDGGTVELDRLGLEWGPLRMMVNGTLALDGELQPQAALTAEVHGAQAVLGAVQPMLRPNEVAMARTVLTMLSRPTGPAGEPVITAPVTVQDRALFLGPVKVASVPRVVW
ncbi:DUF2125 domain-containing protein [Azospirillum thermophilum]|uniref:DUF2125 domain-containing protein n=1 Tax=Azospirillum thermophilum TaxID=2202148 RepID=A0A2S2CWT1_9PROT|nr:DUF2125 domain-containing protein [Azospirillum thermophilum]AWK88983.1 DUF2125 domain-containing protein [Azospirillum thermophilum]